MGHDTNLARPPVCPLAAERRGLARESADEFSLGSIRRPGVARDRPVLYDQRGAAFSSGAAMGIVVSRDERSHLRDSGRETRGVFLQPGCRTSGGGGCRAYAAAP